MSICNDHENLKETTANNLGLHLTELHKTIKSLQADLTRCQGGAELMAQALSQPRSYPNIVRSMQATIKHYQDQAAREERDGD